MPLGMGSLASKPGSDAQWGYPQGGYTTLGGVPKQLPQLGSSNSHFASLGKYPWLYGDLPPRALPTTNEMGPVTDDYGVAEGQKSRRPQAPGTHVFKRTAGPGKGQNLFGQSFKGGIW